MEVRDFDTEVDDAVTVFATGTRNALRPFCCPPENYWGKMDRSVTILFCLFSDLMVSGPLMGKGLFGQIKGGTICLRLSLKWLAWLKYKYSI